MNIKKFLPQTLLGRSILIVIVPVVILQAFTVFMFFERHWSKMTSRLAFAVAGEIAVIADTLDKSPMPEETAAGINGLAARNLDLIVSVNKGEDLAPVIIRTSFLKQMVVDTLHDELDQALNRPFTVRMIEDDGKVEVKVKLKQGVLTVMTLKRRLYSSSSYIFLLWMFSISILLSVIAVMFMRNQIRPIRKLAIAAERFGKGQDAENFKPEGAREVRQAARSFIDMRDRIRRQIEQRTAMLAGVSHDLRTPMTRLKLGLSMMGEGAEIKALRDDLTAMERMINAYLDFARGEGDGGERQSATDISRLLRQMVSREQRTGANLTADIQDGLYQTVRPLSLERAIGNIVSNAHKYGQKSYLAAHLSDEYLTITIEDDGPGIPAEKRTDVFRPFYRLDPARNIDGGGVGLGLSIAQDIIQAHGGHITLDKSTRLGGLKVTIELPR